MGIVLRLAWRNLWRQRRRTWLTVSAIAFVTLLMVFLVTLQLGSYDLMIDSSLRLFTAHLQVQREGFLDRPQMRKTVADAAALGARLRNDPALGAVAVAVRAQAFALASSARRSYGVQVVGVEPQFEPGVSTIPGLIRAGRYLSRPHAQEAVLGAALAHNLDVRVGDELTLLGSALDGSVAASVVTVAGIFESGMRDVDRSLVELPLATFQELFAMDGSAHAIVLLAPDLGALPRLKEAVARALPPGAPLVVHDWEQLFPGLRQLIEADWTTAWFTYVALIVVVTFSILNTFLMSVLERTREFGILLALGATPLRIGTLVLAETALLALIGLAIGVGLGLALAAGFSVTGFTYPGLKELMGQYGLPGLIYPKLSARAVLTAPAVIFSCLMLSALYPALRVRRLQPIEAIRAV